GRTVRAPAVRMDGARHGLRERRSHGDLGRGRGRGARPHAPVTRRGSALRLGPLVAVMFFTVSGGSFGLEGLVGSVGPGVAWLLLGATPLVYSVPETLVIGELASMLSVDGGYHQWAERGLGVRQCM